MRDGRTDRQTDGWKEWNQYTPTTTSLCIMIRNNDKNTINYSECQAAIESSISSYIQEMEPIQKLMQNYKDHIIKLIKWHNSFMHHPINQMTQQLHTWYEAMYSIQVCPLCTEILVKSQGTKTPKLWCKCVNYKLQEMSKWLLPFQELCFCMRAQHKSEWHCARNMWWFI